MKYHEAIDMILDGGETYCSEWGNKKYRVFFGEFGGQCSILCYRQIDMSDKADGIHIFNKKEITSTYWIVEKDGVVYEEYPIDRSRMAIAEKNKKMLMEIIGSLEAGEIYPEDLGLHNKKRFMKLYESWSRKKDGVVYEEKPNGSSPLDDLYKSYKEKIIIADEVNEDWLEKKMLCFMRRHFLLKPNALQFCKVCRDKECPFCFPPDKLEEGFSSKLDPYVACLLCGKTMDKCKGHSASEWDDGRLEEQAREKVTVEDLMSFVDYLRQTAYTRGKYQMNYMPDTEKEELETLNKKLEYLVSLQEKK